MHERKIIIIYFIIYLVFVFLTLIAMLFLSNVLDGIFHKQKQVIRKDEKSILNFYRNLPKNICNSTYLVSYLYKHPEAVIKIYLLKKKLICFRCLYGKKVDRKEI